MALIIITEAQLSLPHNNSLGKTRNRHNGIDVTQDRHWNIEIVLFDLSPLTISKRLRFSD